MTKRGSNKLRQEVRARANRLCEYCYCPECFSLAPFELEHIVPSAKGGITASSNLAYACRGCNLNKSDRVQARDPITGRRLRLFHPRRQKWGKHFVWSSDYLLIIGLTATGRATIEALALNRVELVNLRRALYLCGEHPPIT